MAKFRKKPVEIEALTFNEMLQYGAENGGMLVDGVPESFMINNYPIWRVYNNYKIRTLEGDHLMTRDDILIIGVKGEIYPCKKDIFEMTYDKIEGEEKSE